MSIYPRAVSQLRNRRQWLIDHGDMSDPAVQDEIEAITDELAAYDEEETIPPRPPLTLVGEDGNAFSVLGRALRTARQAGWTQAQLDEYRVKATSGNYDQLLRVTMEYFDVH